MEVSADERIEQAAAQLSARIQSRSNQNLTDGTVRDLRRLVKSHRIECKLRGVKFPELVVVALQKRGIVEVLREDLAIGSILGTVAVMKQKYAHLEIPEEEIVEAVWREFPRQKAAFAAHLIQRGVIVAAPASNA